MSGRETKVNDEKETYTMKDFYNPLIGMDYPDPDLIRVGDIWYMISTTMHFMPGGEILRSYNLTDWERVGYVFWIIHRHSVWRMEKIFTDRVCGQHPCGIIMVYSMCALLPMIPIALICISQKI